MALGIAVVLPLVSGASGGFNRHLMEIVSRWAESERVGDLVIHAPSGIEIPGVGELGVRVVRHAASPLLRLGKRWAPDLWQSQDSVIFSLTTRPIRVPTQPYVTLAQNVEPIQASKYARSHLWRLRSWTLRRETLSACQKATRVIAVSHYVKECLSSLGVQPNKIDVVYHGADLPAKLESQPLACGTVKEPFIFTAGSLVPYRGLEDLVRAMRILKQNASTTPLAVIAGSGSALARSYERWIRGLARDLDVQDKVVWAGQLSASEMMWCLNRARIVVQTSRAEAFSIFQVEALCAGSVLVSCTQPPMPEILGDAATYYPTGDPTALARALSVELTATAAEVEARRCAARKRAETFSWEREAELTLDSLERATEGYRATDQ